MCFESWLPLQCTGYTIDDNWISFCYAHTQCTQCRVASSIKATGLENSNSVMQFKEKLILTTSFFILIANAVDIRKTHVWIGTGQFNPNSDRVGPYNDASYNQSWKSRIWIWFEYGFESVFYRIWIWCNLFLGIGKWNWILTFQKNLFSNRIGFERKRSISEWRIYADSGFERNNIWRFEFGL